VEGLAEEQSAFPMHGIFVTGTQADCGPNNSLYVVRYSNMHETLQEGDSDLESDDEEDDGDEDEEIDDQGDNGEDEVEGFFAIDEDSDPDPHSAKDPEGSYDLADERYLVKVLSRQQLTKLLEILPSKFGIVTQPRHSGRACIGMVGYPNVGKSSVINTLLGVAKSSHGNPYTT
jgi:hypothetical protein